MENIAIITARCRQGIITFAGKEIGKSKKNVTQKKNERIQS